MSNRFDPNAQQRSEFGSPDLASDPWRAERDAFIQSWVDHNTDLSPAAREHLRALVYAENGPWNDPNNIRDVVEYADDRGVIYLCYSDDGDEIEITFRYT